MGVTEVLVQAGAGPLERISREGLC
jgi:hypothetical protein